MNRHSVHLFRYLICMVLSLAMAAPALAQRGGRTGSELDLLRNEDVLREIGVSSEIIEQMEALRRSTATTRAAFEEFREEMAAAKTNEERTAIRQKIQEAVKSGGVRFQQQALQLLNPKQQEQLRRVYIENFGLDALADDRIAVELQLTAEQRAQIAEFLAARRNAAPDEDVSVDRDTARETWDKELLAVLSPKQLTIWKQQSVSDSEIVANAEAKDSGSPPEARSATNDSATESPPTGEAVADFGIRSDEPGQQLQSFSFNFRHAPWEQVLQIFADGAGLTLDMQRVPPGSLSHLDDNEYTAARALDIINGYLIRKGFGVVRKDGFLVVVNMDEQLDPSLIPEVSLDDVKMVGDRKRVGDNQLVTVRVPVHGLDIGRTAQEIESLLGPWGSMIALTQSQVMMVTDIGANLRRIMGLLDSAARPDELIFTPYHLRNIDVEDAEPLLLTQFGMRQAATNVSAAAEGRSFGSRSFRGGRTSTPAPATPASPENLQVASDVRTNSLLVTGTPAQHVLVAMILKAIDVSESPDGKALSRTGRRGKYLTVYKVSSADAREVTKTLDAILPGMVVNEDGRNGKIHIMATEREHEEVAQLIRQLDGAGGLQSVAVIPLVKMDPVMAAATLRSLFLSEGAEAPTLEADLYGRRLIVRGDPAQVAQIKAVLAQLGEDGSGVRPPRLGGSRRRYSLQGRSPDEFLRILQDTWQDSEPNPIRILVPSRSGPVRERRTSEGPVGDSRNAPPRQPTRDALENSSPQTQTARPATVAGAEYLTVRLQDEQADNPEAEVDDVKITVLGDDLLLSSDDPEALDRLEELLDALQQTLPIRQRWTIFYLQAADAVEAADMLAQIFPSSSVASTAVSTGGSIMGSLANSFSGIGSSLANATGLGGLGDNPQTLRIIPDVRSNSLLIAGPDAVLQDVWAILNVLDSNDIPESFRDMQQRTITLEYADIDNVATILRDVYKPLMEDSNGNRQQRQQNPFAAMLGGAGGSNAESPSLRMTLGVDRRTSSIIVSSSQEIFDDVEELVKTLDKNALLANRRIQVIQLRSVDPASVQRSLTGLFPRVATSAAAIGTARTNDSTTSNQRRGRTSEDRQAADAIRRFQERARGTRQGGGDNTLDGGRTRGDFGGGDGRRAGGGQRGGQQGSR